MKDKDDFSDFEDEFSNESSFVSERSNLDGETFKQRNDPKLLLWRYKLSLLNAYEVDEEITDEETGTKTSKKKIKFRKNSSPIINKQGVEDVINYLEKFVNSHVVQSNIDTMIDFNNVMRFISNDVTAHFHAKRVLWGVEINDIDILISNSTNLIEFILRRALFNKERESYNEGFKENTVREIKPSNKPNILQRFGSYLGGGSR